VYLCSSYFILLEKFMATITLDYNTRNAQAQKALDYVLSLGFFKVRPDRKPRRKKQAAQKVQDPLAEVFGMWADRDIDGKTLRKQAWGIDE
jgi:hypothetical protein